MNRLSKRLLRHHLPLALATLFCGVLLYESRSFSDQITRLSFASAYPALTLLSATLMIGPVKLFSRNRVPISMDFRRDIGIWAGLTGIFHALVGQCVHLRWRPWLYYVYENWHTEHSTPFRHDLFGLANYTGLLAALILLLLLATSNDLSLRTLRAPGWKKLQRWNYAGFALAGVHTIVYQKAIESQTMIFLVLAMAPVGLTIALQYHGFRLRRHTAKLIAAD